MTRDLVSGNTVNGTFNDGIQLPNTDENQVSHNSVGAAHNNGVVNYTGHRNVLSFNTARGSGAFDLFDRSRTRPCDSNTWFGNTYSTANPACTTIGGHQVQGPAPAAAQPAFDQPAGGAQPASTAADLPGRAGAMVPR